MLLILLIILLLLAAGAFPAWPYSATWGYVPSGTIVVIVIVVLLVFLLQGRL